jgi:hypothetical protein
VAELVDARDSKSRFFGSMGSIPIAGTPSLDVVDKGIGALLGALEGGCLSPMITAEMRPYAGKTGNKRAIDF